MKKWIPNLITLINLLCGCIGALFAFNNNLLMAGFFVGLGIFFDFFDGLAARLLKVSSELGTQLDSLADMVTSGLVPGIAMYKLLSYATSSAGFQLTQNYGWYGMSDWQQFKLIPFVGFFITMASCYRLAKFNIDTRQTDSFIGLPTPANAILILSVGIIIQSGEWMEIVNFLSNTYFLIALTLLSCYLLNAELPLFALKFKSFGFKGNEIRWIFIAICIALIVTLKIYAVPLIILIYILMSVGKNLSASRSS